MSLEPLQHSHAVGKVEIEMKDLVEGLYRDYIQAEVDDINVYGAPHLGSFSLIERVIAQEGLTVLRETTEDRIRYLFNAWRNRNPQRGLHFLRTYLTVIFGDMSAEQLWQKKSGTYPQQLKTLSEIAAAGESESDYFLTSRIRVDLTSDIVPEKLAASLKAAVAARFVLNLRIGKRTLINVGFGVIAQGVVSARLTGETAEPGWIAAAGALYDYANFTLTGDTAL